MKALILAVSLVVPLGVLGALKQTTPPMITSDAGLSVRTPVAAADTSTRSAVSVRCDDLADVQTGVKYADGGGVTANDNDPWVVPGSDRVIQLAPGENAVAVKAHDAGITHSPVYADGGDYIDGGTVLTPYGNQSVHCWVHQLSTY